MKEKILLVCLVLMVVGGLVLTACAPPASILEKPEYREEQSASPVKHFGRVSRVVDSEYGVVCYYISSSDVECFSISDLGKGK